MVKFWTRRKSRYLSRKNESNVQQRRLGAVLCGIPERVGAAWDDDAGVLRQEQRALQGDGEYASTIPHWVLNKSAHLCPESKKRSQR